MSQRALWKRICQAHSLDIQDIPETDLICISDKQSQLRMAIIPDGTVNVLSLGEALVARGYGFSQVTIDDADPLSESVREMLIDWGFEVP